MPLNPLNELKRRLDDNDIPLPKRLCLAKNVIQSHHFPAAPKERVVAEWLESITQKKGLSAVEFRNILGWLKIVDDLTSDLKAKLVQVAAEYVQKNPLQNDDIKCIIIFMENENMATQLSRYIDEYLLITITLLKFLNKESLLNTHTIERVLNNLIKYYKESKKKLEFIIKLLDGENLETVFSYLETECRNSVINVCQNILFPINKKSFFISFLQTLIRKENIDDLVAEKGDNIQSVLKIMSAFFTFPKGRTLKDQKFLQNFIDVFVSCFHSESQMIFAFYIMVTNSLKMEQSYLIPTMDMPKIIFEENDEKVKRNLFLNMLEIILQNEVDISVRLTDTFGEKISKVEIKKNFTVFLQSVMMRQLKLEGKLDKTTLQIIKVSLKLDPVLVEQKIDQILPPIMIAKKNNSNIEEAYIDLLNCLLEILFKLSRGNLFLNQILPHVKLCLEACNTEQFELKQKIQECTNSGTDCEKMKNKVITGNDIFPQQCVEMYGKWTSELMFRQNGELLVLLQKDFEEYCLMMLEEGFVSPSIITLCEVLSAILSSFLQYSKMADHTVPRHIAEEFWNAYQKFEVECLKKFGECILKLNYNPPLLFSFLKLCLSFSRLKLLNIKYSNVKLDSPQVSEKQELFDLSVLLPCLSSEQWISLAEQVVEDEAVLLLDNLLLTKAMAIELLLTQNSEEANQAVISIKSHIIKRLTTNPDLKINNSFAKVLFENLNRSQLKPLAKCLVKLFLNNTDVEIFNTDAVINNGVLLNALALETVKNIIKCFENTNSLNKALNKTDFDLATFLKEVNVKIYFNQLSITEDQDVDMLANCVELLKQLQIYSLEEPCQLTVVFVLLALKKCCRTKKLRRNIDCLLQSIFELSHKKPDLYKIFPVNYIFSFEDKTLDLFTLKIKTSNQLLIIKFLLDSAVKKVKTDSEIVKNIIEILLAKQKSINDTPSIEYFSDPVFQICCTILPIIARERKAITTSAYRSILANLQEKLHKTMLDAFKNIDFSNIKSLLDTSGNIDDSMTVSESTLATLNAMDAYSLSLSKYCGTTNTEEIKNLDCLWSGLEFFVQNAIQSIQNQDSKNQHVESSVQLLNVTLRCVKKLETHGLFQNKDELFLRIWRSVKTRLLITYDEKQRGKKKQVSNSCLEDIAATLKLISELTSVESFDKKIVEDLKNLTVLKKPSVILKEEAANTELTSHKVSQYMWTNILKANIVGPKCNALSKLMFQICKNLRFWIQQNFESDQNGVVDKKSNVKNKSVNIDNEDVENEVKIVKVEEIICDIIQIDLKTLSEAILAAKKINIDYKFLDAIFELQHLINYILGCNMANRRCEVSWQAFFKLFSGSLTILNSLFMSREEILEDRWPCYMQCYRALVSQLCERSTSQLQLEKMIEEKLAETSHSIEKLTQYICKRKAHISRLAAYTVADICSWLEGTTPSRMVRQHLENSVAFLIQASDSTHAMAFLRRALAGSAGQMTMTNLYTMYKRYHKYVGNA